MNNASQPAGSELRSTYHHGDLRSALVAAGLALAREGGPQAVVLREVTRRAGVAPNAAYRHFANREALYEAVRTAAVAALSQSIETHMEAAKSLGDPQERARALLAAVGRGYLDFAQAETGWFRTAFAFASGEQESAAPSTNPPESDVPALEPGVSPFALLGYALDAMAEAGVLPLARRPMAEYLAWSAVHGMAILIIDGPLRKATPEQRTALSQRLLQMVETGI